MGDLIDDLLRFATIGRQPPLPQRTPLNLLVDGALTRLGAQSAGRQIEWRIGELGSVECDFAMMRTVFEELLGNAIKYSRGREPAVIEVSRLEAGEETMISIRDNGAGFDMDFAGKLFGVFQRLHKTRDFEGTGIGLATVQRIIHKHGGRVWAEAEVDRGAVFFFSFPGMRNVLDSVECRNAPHRDEGFPGGSGSVRETEGQRSTEQKAHSLSGRK
jgi:light-regulated signal transduction histidine kinase (bacteriophytochrome)